jgi:hypothetical protein
LLFCSIMNMNTCGETGVLTSFVLVGQRFHFVNKYMENEMVSPDFCRSCQHIAELCNGIEPVILYVVLDELGEVCFDKR